MCQKCKAFVKKHKKGAAVAVGVAALVVAAAWCPCRGPSVGVVDFDEVRQQADVFKAIAGEQQKHEQTLRAQASGDIEALQKADQALVEQKSKLSAAELRKKVEALQKQAEQVQIKYRGQAAQIMRATQMAVQGVEPGVMKAVEEVGKARRVDVILVKGGTIYAGPKADLTADLVKALNKSGIEAAYPDPEKIQASEGQ